MFRRPAAHWLVVGSQRFAIRPAAYDRMAKGGHAVVYYVDLGLTRHLLSVAWTP